MLTKEHACMQIREKQGTMVTSEKEQEKRWKEQRRYYTAQIRTAEQKYLKQTPIWKSIQMSHQKLETIASIKSLKNNKAPGNDNLTAEIFEADPIIAADILYPLF